MVVRSAVTARVPEEEILVLGLIRLLLRFAWLGIMVLGIRRIVELVQDGVDQVVRQIETGESSGVAGALIRVHEALHRRHGHDLPAGDVVGEM